MSGPTAFTSDAAANSYNRCTTKCQLLELSSTWNIENAHLLWQSFSDVKLDYIESSEFCSSDASFRWRMCLEPNIYNTEMTACLKMKCDAPVRVRYEISLPSLSLRKRSPYGELIEEKPIVWKKSLKLNQELNSNSENDQKGSSIGLKLETFFKMLEDIRKNANGTLILSCKIIVIKAVNIDFENRKVQPSAFPVFIDTDLLLEGKYSDIILAVGQHEIKAHKVMLASQSPVFRAMFDSDMQESLTNRVVITDLDHEVIQEMIHFIYTGESPKLKTMADRLMGAAVKYDLGKLRTSCEQTLCAELSVDNAIKLMTIAELYEAKQLKARVSAFITNNLEKIVEKSVLEDLKQQLKLGIN